MAAPCPPFIRFHRMMKKDAGGCWLWTGRLGSSGYGQFKVFGEMMSAHRFAYTLYSGPIPDGLHILHSCDNKICVNPEHLRAGTRSENIKEAVERGQLPSGKSHIWFGKRGESRTNAQPVFVLGKEYPSHNAAERALGLGNGTVRYWIRNNPSKAYIINKEVA